MPRFYHLLLTLFLVVTSALPAPAEVTVSMTPPQLISQLSSLQPTLALELDQVAGQIQVTLNSFLNKPLVLGAFADAGTMSVLPVWRSPWNGLRYAFSLSNTASVEVDDWNFATWLNRFSNLSPTADYLLGINLSPTTLWWGGSLAPWWPSLYAKVVAGWSQYSYESYQFLSKSLGLFAAWQMVKPLRWSPWWSWLGLEATSGLGWNDNEASAVLNLPTVNSSFRVGATGPYPSMQLTYTVTPQVQVSVVTQTLTLPFQLSTGVEWARIFELSAGFGNYLSWGNSAIGLAGTQTVSLLTPPFNQLVVGNPGLTFNGYSNGSGHQLTGTYFWFRLGYKVGLITIEIPVVYRLLGGVETGVQWGAEF